MRISDWSSTCALPIYRLNALGERLTRSGKLGDGEFNFIDAPGVGGVDPSTPQSAPDVQNRISELAAQFNSTGAQLSLIEALLADQDEIGRASCRERVCQDV